LSAFLAKESIVIDLSGKVALITGSSRGIGRGCALEMARAGADIAINYRSHGDEAEDVALQVRALGRRAGVYRADVSQRDQVDAMVAATVEELGRVDILVNNAYYSKREPFLEMTVEGMRQTLDVTLWGTFHASQAAARQMVAQGDGGSIVCITSVLAAMPMPTSLAYNTAKAGLNHMVRTMANELLEHRIRANAIEPGWIDTPGERQFTSDEEMEKAAPGMPWGRLGTSEDIGRAATYLASSAADYVTGTVLRVDGGLSLR
jgi:glucose 1-dehydrogenase